MSRCPLGDVATIAVRLGVLLLCSPAWSCPIAQQQAPEILQATGTKGGLVIHLGCGEGRLTAALRAGESYLVHGLDRDPSKVATARDHLHKLGLYGTVSVDVLQGRRLPYVDNLANLIVVEALDGIPSSEVMRVLAPQGSAYIRSGGKWTRTVKPRPPEIDEWTHYLHDPSNNAVAHDSLVGPPRHLQWIGSPRWSRHHDHMASMSALVSAGGRIFYILDEGSRASILLASKWSIVARDAFNGTILWKRPIARWYTHLFRLKSGPALSPESRRRAGGVPPASDHRHGSEPRRRGGAHRPRDLRSRPSDSDPRQATRSQRREGDLQLSVQRLDQMAS